MYTILRLCVVLFMSAGTTSMTVRAADAPPLASVVTLDDLVITPDAVHDGQPFTISARVANHGDVAITDLLWFPSVLADPAHPSDHPQMEVLDRFPRQLSLEPGTETQISLSFRVTTPGERQYGLLATLPDRSRGIVFLADTVPHQTLPQSRSQGVRRLAAFGLPLSLFLAAFVWGVQRSHRLRRAVIAQLHPQWRTREIIAILLATVALFTVLNLSMLVDRANEAKILPDLAYGWSLYLLIPLRWLVPLLLAFILARGHVPSLVVAAVFLAAYTQANAALFTQVPHDIFFQLWSPGLVLLTLFVASRTRMRAPRPPPLTFALTLMPVLWYVAIALPWLQLYTRQVLLRTP